MGEAATQPRPSAPDHLRFVRAEARPWADLGVVAAGIGALVINGAQAALTIQIETVIVAHSGQGEDPRLLIETLDDAVLLQALGNVLGRLVLVEVVDHANTDQIFDLHFHRQRAAGRMAAPAHMAGVALPGIEAVDFSRGNQGRFHSYKERITVEGRAMIPELFKL